MTTQTVGTQTTSSNLVDTIIKGITAGLVAGSVFGVMMATMGMMPMIADMIGSTSIVVGFILHMIISAAIGGSYAIIAERIPNSWIISLGAGSAYGIVWWVLGALIIMPLVLGMNDMVLVIEDMQLMSLIGHVMFGVVLGTLYTLINKLP
ncbi:MAG: hypothetical protein Kow00117_13430 [Phototrophicales bacterium]